MLRDILYFEDLASRLDNLVIYRNIMEDELVATLYNLAKCLNGARPRESATQLYYQFISLLIRKAEEHGLSDNLFGKYIAMLYLNDENVFSLACENNIRVEGSNLYNIVMKDINTLYFLINLDVQNMADNLGANEKIAGYTALNVVMGSYVEHMVNTDSHEGLIEALVLYYRLMGAGKLGTYRMLRFDKEKGIVGVPNYDSVVFDDIIGCDHQKRILINNTEAFLTGAAANNVLLTGSRGTGKSSCVKALANKYHDRGLRLLEISKEQIVYLPRIMSQIANRGKKFIIFIDDLSFDDFEVQFKYMKSILEGSVSACPSNTLFYATSNRRHVIHEKWSDKDGALDGEEIHTTDTVNEKLSLSDRFGITLTFPKPSPDEYVNIVVGLAKKEKLSISEDFLREQAMKWELNQRNFSGRTARQFINNIIWELTKE